MIIHNDKMIKTVFEPEVEEFALIFSKRYPEPLCTEFLLAFASPEFKTFNTSDYSAFSLGNDLYDYPAWLNQKKAARIA